MVKIMEIPIEMDDLGRKKTIFGNTHKGSNREQTERQMMSWIGGVLK